MQGIEAKKPKDAGGVSFWKTIKITGMSTTLAFAMATPVAAHDSYFLPQGFVSPNLSLDLPFTSSETFPALEYGPKKKRILASAAKSAGHPALLDVVREGSKALTLRLTVKAPGLYAAAISLGPHPIMLSPEKVKEYIAEIGADQSVRDAYAALPAPRVWNEVYTKYAKTLVCMQTCSGQEVARQPFNIGLEFIVAKPPPKCSGRAFQLLMKGRPAPGQAVAMISAMAKRELLQTNPSGLICLPSARIGPTLLSAVIVQPHAGQPFTSDFTTLTFDSTGWNR